MKKIINFIPLLLFFISCKKYVAIPPPPNALTADMVFTDDSKATAAVTSIYGNMINKFSFASFQSTLYGSVSSDDLIPYNSGTTYDELYRNELTPINPQILTIWTSCYQNIYHCNAVMQGLINSAQVSDGLKQQLVAECKFTRAFCYFYLLNFFGDVPLVTGTDYRVNANLPRTAKSEIYTFIIGELTEAKAIIPATYTGTEKVRPNKWAVASLLARVYLYTGNWDRAESESSEVIGTGLYSPLPAPQLVYQKNNKEAIWQLMPVNAVLTEGSQLRPNGGNPTYYLSPALMTTFPATDLRRQKWIDSITSNAIKYYYAGKYKNTSGTVSEYYTVFRLAEQYLISAEAKLHKNNLQGAIDDVNVIRLRAGVSSLPSNMTAAETGLAIENERRLEFFCELGHRWFDLNRTNRSDIVIGTLKSTWQPTDRLYPVPGQERIANHNLSQNPGY